MLLLSNSVSHFFFIDENPAITSRKQLKTKIKFPDNLHDRIGYLLLDEIWSEGVL